MARRTAAVAIIVLLLASGCGTPGPATTLAPPTNPPASPEPTVPPDTPAPTTTSLSPTETPAPSPIPSLEPTTVAYELISNVPYVTGGDSRQTLTFYLPDRAQRIPLALFVPGGEYMPDFVHYFTSRGYPVISFSGRDESYQAEMRDTFCALAWVQANASTYDLNPEQVVPVGVSMWGGNAALLGMVDDPTPFLEGCPHSLPEADRVQAVVALAGVFDYAEEGDFFAGFIEAITDFMGGPPDQVPELWAAASAITWVDGREPPFLLVHGTEDVNVDVHQSERFAAALAEAGVDVELVLLPKVDHPGIIESEEVFAAVEAFLDGLLAQEEAGLSENGEGGWIVFQSDQEGNYELYAIHVAGTNQRRLTDNDADDLVPQWSPDGTQIVFISNREGNNEIYVMDVPDGADAPASDPQQLTDTSADEFYPAWSPSGAQIAFNSDEGGDWEIYVMELDGSNRQQLTDNQAEDARPNWSPDGRQIAFSSDRNGDSEIYVMDADGGNLQQLTRNDAGDWHPAWSPDGAQIAFTSIRDGNMEIYVMDADGSNQRRLTDNQDWDGIPVWSPDGSQIAFNSDRGTGGGIYLMDTDGRNQRLLTDGNASHHSWGPAVAAPADAQAHALGDTWTRPSDGMAMVYVPAGTFPMGSTAAEVDDALAQCSEVYTYCNRSFYGQESPQHTVTLDGFWIDQTEVSNAQYRQCVEAGICPEPTTCDQGEPTYQDASKGEHPVVCVSWPDAQAYCQWVGAQLPSEAQWEYAARGPAGYTYPWGNVFDGARLNYCDVNCEFAWADGSIDDGYAETAPVGNYPSGASWCGALDMAGNVSEWTADWLGSYTAEGQVNPAGPTTGQRRVVRGNSWRFFWVRFRTAARDSVPPELRYSQLGFRCVVPAGP